MSQKTDAYLSVRLEGPAIGPARMPLRDFITLADEMLSAVERVALTLLSESGSIRRGRRPAALREALSLDFVGYTHGSPSVVAYFERSVSQLEFTWVDLGNTAYEAWLGGINQIARYPHSLPKGFDTGVLLKTRDIGKLLDRGITSVEFQLNHRPIPFRTVLNKDVSVRIARQITQPEALEHTVDGRLMMADFKATGRQFRVHPPFGEPILCEFDPEYQDEVQDNILRYVRVQGKAELSPGGRIHILRTTNVERLEEPTDIDMETMTPPVTDAFWHHRKVEDLATAQGAPLAADFDALLGGWPGDTEDGFEEWIDSLRGGYAGR